MTELAQKITGAEYSESKRADAVRTGERIQAVAEELANLERGGKDDGEVDPTLRDHAAEARAPAVDRREGASAPGKTQDSLSEKEGHGGRDF